MSEGNQQFPEPPQQSDNEEPLDQNDAISDNSQTNDAPDNQNTQTNDSQINDNTVKNDDDKIHNIGDETLVDMFSYYFIQFLKEAENSSPKPSYFTQLSQNEKHLLQVFKQYYHVYKAQF